MENAADKVVWMSEENRDAEEKKMFIDRKKLATSLEVVQLSELLHHRNTVSKDEAVKGS